MPYKKEVSSEILELCALDVKDYEPYRNRHASLPENKEKRKAILNAYAVFLSEPQYNRHRKRKKYNHVLEYAESHVLPEPSMQEPKGHKLYRVLSEYEEISYVFDVLSLTKNQLKTLEEAEIDIDTLPKTRGDSELDLKKRSIRRAYKRMVTDPQLQPFLLKKQYQHVPILDHKLITILSYLPLTEEDPLKKEKEHAAERKASIKASKKRVYQHNYRIRRGLNK